MRKRYAAGAALLALVLAGCGDKYNEQFKDASRAGSNTGAAETLTFPDGFSNAATKCDHGNRVYILFHGNSSYGSIAVVGADPTCKGVTP